MTETQSYDKITFETWFNWPQDNNRIKLYLGIILLLIIPGYFKVINSNFEVSSFP